jgi:NADP-dependent aldehyde dehydrogenase
MSRVLITGAAGAMGGMLRTRLARPGRALRLVDIVEAPAGDDAEVLVGDVTQLAEMVAACADVDAIVHLAGISSEDAWEGISTVNVQGTRQILEAARIAGVPRVILASSNHAVGMYERAADDLPDDLPPRPDTYYGWSKAAMEAMGRLYADRFGLTVIATRIGSCFETPSNERMLATWLSPDDAGRLFEACLTADRPGFTLVWGVSANTRRWWSTKVGDELGYRPLDDSEIHASDALPPSDRYDLDHVGGLFCRAPLGARIGG